VGSIKKDTAIRADNDAAELKTEQLVEAFKRIKDPEVRASIIALVTRLAETAANMDGFGRA